MVLRNFKINTDFNEVGILASYNVQIKAPLDPAGDNQTQVEGIRSWMYVEFMRPLKSLPTICNTQNS